jgi:hypothetical protein
MWGQEVSFLHHLSDLVPSTESPRKGAHPDIAASPSPPALDPSARIPTVLAHPHPEAQGGSCYLAGRATALESDTALSISKVDALVLLR